MSPETLDLVRRLADNLDHAVPPDGAVIAWDIYGGGVEEGQFVANRAGYARFAAALLKAATADTPSDEPGRAPLAVALGNLVAEWSDIQFGEFVLDTSVSPSKSATLDSSRIVGAAIGVGCLAAGIAVLALAVYGLSVLMK